jgi:hypothetical protein
MCFYFLVLFFLKGDFIWLLSVEIFLFIYLWKPSLLLNFRWQLHICCQSNSLKKPYNLPSHVNLPPFQAMLGWVSKVCQKLTIHDGVRIFMMDEVLCAVVNAVIWLCSTFFFILFSSLKNTLLNNCF